MCKHNSEAHALYSLSQNHAMTTLKPLRGAMFSVAPLRRSGVPCSASPIAVAVGINEVDFRLPLESPNDSFLHHQESAHLLKPLLAANLGGAHLATELLRGVLQFRAILTEEVYPRHQAPENSRLVLVHLL